MDIDLNQFYTRLKPIITSWGFAGNTLTVYCRETNIPLKSYYDGYHLDNPRHWKKLFAEDLRSKTIRSGH
jgi:hypothetical protein